MVLDRYIFRIWAGPFAGGMLVVLGILLLGRALKLLGQIGDSPDAWRLMGELLVFTIPYFLLLTIPMAFFLSMQNTITSLQQNSEMDAMRAAGISYTRMFRSLLAMAVILWFSLSYVALYMLPQSQLNFNQLLLKVYELKGALSFSPQRFSQDSGPITVYVEGERENNVYQGIFLEDRQQQAAVFYLAEEGEFRPAGNRLQLILRHGVRLEGQGISQRMLRFEEYKVSLPIQTLRMKRQHMSDHPTRMKPAMLWEHIQKTKDPIAIAEWHRRLGLPFLVIVLFLFALPLSLTPKRSGKAGSLLIGIGLLIALYNMQLLLLRQIEQGHLPGWSIWLSHMTTFGLGLYLWRRAERDRLPSLLAQGGESIYLAHQWLLQRLSRRLGEPGG